MIYGIENNTLNEPFSLIVSLILFLGIFFIGDLAVRLSFTKFDKLNYKENYIFFSPIVGTYISIFVIYILINLGVGKHSIKFFGYLFFLLGLINIFFIYNKIIIYFRKKNFNLNFIIILLILTYFGLCLMSLSPITHVDSLHYHVTGALNLLNYGHFQKEILPMDTNLVSIGEIILAIGFSLKAEQFGALIQFSSLLALIPIFKNKKNNNYFILQLILITPITLFLVSSPKPQLLYSIGSLVIFALLLNFDKISKYNLKIIFPIIILVLALNGLVKYIFLLSSMLLGLYSLHLMKKKGLFLYSLITILLIFVLTFLPIWYFRYSNFDTGILHLILSPLPLNIYGYQGHHDLLSGGNISIIGLFIPESLKHFTNSYGPIFLISLFLINKRIISYKIPALIIFLFFLLVFLFGSNMPRFLFEGYIWFLYLISRAVDKKNKSYKIFSNTIYLQSIIIIFIISFFVIKIFPGSFSNTERQKVMNNHADAYSIANWSNQNLDKDNVLLSTHRSISLFNNETYPHMFTWHIVFKDKRSIIYYDFLKLKKVDRILFYGNELETEPFTKCLGKQLFFKEKVGKKVGRNPFTESSYYNGWIYDFQSSKLPDCLIR